MRTDRMDQRLCEHPAVPSADLVQRVEARTHRQVRDLEINCSGLRITVSGVSKSYYVKQLVTHAILAAAGRVELENRITVLAN